MTSDTVSLKEAFGQKNVAAHENTAGSTGIAAGDPWKSQPWPAFLPFLVEADDGWNRFRFSKFCQLIQLKLLPCPGL